MQSQRIWGAELDDAGKAVHDHGDGHSGEQQLRNMDMAMDAGDDVDKEDGDSCAQKSAERQGVSAQKAEYAK